MLTLHVWGSSGKISVISPECIAASWLINLVAKQYKLDKVSVVTSCNTNVTDSGKLPLLVDDEGENKIEGYMAIVDYLSDKFKDDTASGQLQFLKDGELSPELQLINKSIMSFITTKIHVINQYNLYISSANYEQYTRKQFKYYLPFPMMYNQPLKFYNVAKEEIKTVGIGVNKTGLFSFSSNSDVAPTETVNDDDDDTQLPPGQQPISKLHEKQLLLKNKKLLSIRESKNTLRAMSLLSEFISKIEGLYQEIKPDKEYSFLTSENKLTSSELLLMAYISTISFDDLPDRNMYQMILTKNKNLTQFCNETSSKLNELLDTSNIIRDPESEEIPNLYNEVKYWCQMIKY